MRVLFGLHHLSSNTHPHDEEEGERCIRRNVQKDNIILVCVFHTTNIHNISHHFDDLYWVDGRLASCEKRALWIHLLRYGMDGGKIVSKVEQTNKGKIVSILESTWEKLHLFRKISLFEHKSVMVKMQFSLNGIFFRKVPNFNRNLHYKRWCILTRP